MAYIIKSCDLFWGIEFPKKEILMAYIIKSCDIF